MSTHIPPGWMISRNENGSITLAKGDDIALIASKYTDTQHGIALYALASDLLAADHSAGVSKMIGNAPETPDGCAAAVPPIDMVLHCPKCGMQHVDAPEPLDPQWTPNCDIAAPWRNPLHRSHLCHGCGHIWRPADVPTNGVAAIKTKGKADSPAGGCAHPAASIERAAPGAVPDVHRKINERAVSATIDELLEVVRSDAFEKGRASALAAAPALPTAPTESKPT